MRIWARITISLLLLAIPAAAQRKVFHAQNVAPVGGAITRVEVVSANGSCVSGLTVNFGTNTTAGELIDVMYVATPSGSTAVTITDSASDTFVKDWEKLSVDNHTAPGFAHLANTASGISSVKITGGATDSGCAVIAAHYTGLATSPLDQNSGTPTPFGSQTSPYTYASATVTTTNASELLAGGCMGFERSGSGNLAFAATGSWTLIKSQLVPANPHGICMQEQIVSSIQTNIANTGTISNGTTVDGVAGIVTFHQ